MVDDGRGYDGNASRLDSCAIHAVWPEASIFQYDSTPSRASMWSLPLFIVVVCGSIANLAYKSCHPIFMVFPPLCILLSIGLSKDGKSLALHILNQH